MERLQQLQSRQQLYTAVTTETPTMATQIDSTSLETVIQSAVQASVPAMSEAIRPMLSHRDPGQALPVTLHGRAISERRVENMGTGTTTAAAALAHHQGPNHHTHDSLDRPVAVPAPGFSLRGSARVGRAHSCWFPPHQRPCPTLAMWMNA